MTIDKMKRVIRTPVALIVAASIILMIGSCRLRTNSSTTIGNHSNKSEKTYVWTKTQMPNMGWPTSLVCGPGNKVFVGTQGINFNGVILCSEAGGKSWRVCSRGITKCWINTLAVDRSGRIYAGTGRGVYSSSDGGNSWHATNTGLSSLGVTVLARGPNGEIYAGTKGNIFRLTTDKERWSKAFSCLGPDAISVNSEGIVYAIEDNKLLRFDTKSRNGNQILPIDSSDDNRMTCAIVDSNNNVYAGFDPVTWSSKTHEFEWTDKPALMKSNGGNGWKALKINNNRVCCADFAIGPKGEIIAATGDGPFASYDDGDNWHSLIPEIISYHIATWIYRGDSLVAIDSVGRIYYLDQGEKVIWCGIPSAK